MGKKSIEVCRVVLSGITSCPPEAFILSTPSVIEIQGCNGILIHLDLFKGSKDLGAESIVVIVDDVLDLPGPVYHDAL